MTTTTSSIGEYERNLLAHYVAATVPETILDAFPCYDPIDYSRNVTVERKRTVWVDKLSCLLMLWSKAWPENFTKNGVDCPITAKTLRKIVTQSVPKSYTEQEQKIWEVFCTYIGIETKHTQSLKNNKPLLSKELIKEMSETITINGDIVSLKTPPSSSNTESKTNTKQKANTRDKWLSTLPQSVSAEMRWIAHVMPRLLDRQQFVSLKDKDLRASLKTASQRILDSFLTFAQNPTTSFQANMNVYWRYMALTRENDKREDLNTVMTAFSAYLGIKVSPPKKSALLLNMTMGSLGRSMSYKKAQFPPTFLKKVKGIKLKELKALLLEPN